MSVVLLLKSAVWVLSGLFCMESVAGADVQLLSSRRQTAGVHTGRAETQLGASNMLIVSSHVQMDTNTYL